MFKTLFLFSILSFLALTSFKRNIYKRNKTYVYDAFYIKSNGDTLTKETIILQPKGRPWIFQFSQTAYKVTYNPQNDSLENWIDPVNKHQQFREQMKQSAIKQGVEWVDHWVVESRSGAVENKTEVWTHPFRSNQYNLTEIAPFPEVDRNKLYKDSVWHTGFILGWDNWQGTIDNEYKVIRQKNYQYKKTSLKNCWEIIASGKHSNPKLGVNYNHYLFHTKYGFVELNYTFYNGVKIHFKLKEIIYKKSK